MPLEDCRIVSDSYDFAEKAFNSNNAQDYD